MTEGQKERRRQAMRRYLATPAGKAARARAVRRYNNSAKGRAARVAYNASVKGILTTMLYRRRQALMHSVPQTGAD